MFLSIPSFSTLPLNMCLSPNASSHSTLPVVKNVKRRRRDDLYILKMDVVLEVRSLFVVRSVALRVHQTPVARYFFLTVISFL